MKERKRKKEVKRKNVINRSHSISSATGQRTHQLKRRVGMINNLAILGWVGQAMCWVAGLTQNLAKSASVMSPGVD